MANIEINVIYNLNLRKKIIDETVVVFKETIKKLSGFVGSQDIKNATNMITTSICRLSYNSEISELFGDYLDDEVILKLRQINKSCYALCRYEESKQNLISLLQEVITLLENRVLVPINKTLSNMLFSYLKKLLEKTPSEFCRIIDVDTLLSLF